MKKMAVCLRGDFRNWDIMKDYFFYTFTKFSNMGYEIDFFINTYDKVAYHHKKDIGRSIHDGVGSFRYSVPLRSDKIRKDFKKYNLKSFEILNSTDRNWLMKHLHVINPTLSQYYSIYMVNKAKRREEKKQNIEYDVVINTRTDLLYRLDGLKHCVSNAQSLELNRNPVENHSLTGTILNAQDFLFVGDSSTLDIVSNFFWEIRTDKKFNSKYCCTHTLLAVYLRRNAILLYYPPVHGIYRRCSDINKAWHCDASGADPIFHELVKDWHK